MIAILTTNDDKTEAFYDYNSLWGAMFNPTNDYNLLILDRINGKTYDEKKAIIEDKAIQFSNIDKGGMYWSDFINITEYFERYGRRYGLLKEFRENAII